VGEFPEQALTSMATPATANERRRE